MNSRQVLTGGILASNRAAGKRKEAGQSGPSSMRREQSEKTGPLHHLMSILMAGSLAETRCASLQEILSASIRRNQFRAPLWKKRLPGTTHLWTAVRTRILKSRSRNSKFKHRRFMPRGQRPAFTIAFPACASTEKLRSSIFGARLCQDFTVQGKRQAGLISTDWRDR